MMPHTKLGKHILGSSLSELYWLLASMQTPPLCFNKDVSSVFELVMRYPTKSPARQKYCLHSVGAGPSKNDFSLLDASFLPMSKFSFFAGLDPCERLATEHRVF